MSPQDKGLPPRWRRHVTVTMLAIAVIAVIAVVIGLRRAADAPMSELAPNAATTTDELLDADAPSMVAASSAPQPSASAPAITRDVQRAPPLTAANEPAAAAIATLLPMAEAGHAEAMAELAQRLIACRDVAGVDEARLRQIALQRFYRWRGREPSSDDELSHVAGQLERDVERADLCREIDPALMDARIDWLERAARAGDVGAMLDYAGYALNDLRGNGEILRNFDEVGRRRQLAGELLRRALDRGACEALPMLSAAYSGGRNRYDWLYAADPYQSLVYAEAAARSGNMEMSIARARERLADPARQAAAAAQGQMLAARHCGRAG